VVGAEDRIQNLDKKGYRSLGKMLQCPVRDTARARSLADLKAPDGFLNLVWIG
jgi:ppGpp synthetase/RelA/SpoT-type nucleotidyltranferase